MSLLPIRSLIKNQTQLKLRKEKKKAVAPVILNSKKPEVKYRRQLNQLVRLLIDAVKRDIEPLLFRLAPEYVSDSYATTLEQAFDNLRRSFNGVGTQAQLVANSFVDDTNIVNKDRFYRAVNKAVGVNLSSIVQDEGLSDILKATTRSNVGLITSISDEHFKKLEQIVFDGTIRGNRPASMITEIRKLNKDEFKRAKLIARDQTSKLNSALTQQRQENLGVTEYIWRTSEDGERVRPTHRANNGKVFKWSKPPKKTGHPGQDIQCRCVAQPVIKI